MVFDLQGLSLFSFHFKGLSRYQPWILLPTSTQRLTRPSCQICLTLELVENNSKLNISTTPKVSTDVIGIDGIGVLVCSTKKWNLTIKAYQSKYLTKKDKENRLTQDKSNCNLYIHATFSGSVAVYFECFCFQKRCRKW